MIIFFDKRDGKVFGTVDGRVHDDDFAHKIMMGSSEIPEDQVGKYIVPVAPIKEVTQEPIYEQFANPENDFKVEQRQIGTQQVERIVEIGFDEPFKDVLYAHEYSLSPLQLIKCTVVTDESGQVVDIRTPEQ